MPADDHTLLLDFGTSATAEGKVRVKGQSAYSVADFERAATYFERMGSTEKYVNEKGDEVEVSGDDEQAVETIAGLVEQDLDA